MLPSLNYDSKDPKFTLLNKIFKIIDSKKFKDTCNRKGITNRQMMVDSIKILFMVSVKNLTDEFIFISSIFYLLKLNMLLT